MKTASAATVFADKLCFSTERWLGIWLSGHQGTAGKVWIWVPRITNEPTPSAVGQVPGSYGQFDAPWLCHVCNNKGHWKRFVVS